MADNEEGVAGVWSTQEMKIARSRLASAAEGCLPARAWKIGGFDALVVVPVQLVSQDAGDKFDHLRE